MALRTVHYGSVHFLYREGVVHTDKVYWVQDAFQAMVDALCKEFPEVEENTSLCSQAHGAYELQSANLEQLTAAHKRLLTFARRRHRLIEILEDY